ncbi:hypothetical protein AB6A40_009368 [Gnathostoma spinigerum]|uniref:Reverse transcriptase domain-containing protein n=1 Tax=Gnathostoma spinigerum TaxID=75299 RepID=A0ABD6EWW8_9BILA
MLGGKGKIKLQKEPKSPVLMNTGFTMSPAIKIREDEVEKFWKLETIGISETIGGKEDRDALWKFQKHIEGKQDGRYIVGLPWKTDSPKVPYNLGICIGRLKGALKKLEKKPELFEEYDKVFRQQIEQGVIEEVPRQEAGPLVSYLPHQPVLTADKATIKLRVVFDASAKDRHGNSVNKQLLRGPVMLNDLSGILLRFRLSNIAIIADVEKAFLQIELREDDRDCTRFMWVKDPGKAEADNIIAYRFCRVPLSLMSSPFFLAATLYKQMGQADSKISKMIMRNLYVDNVILTADTTQEADQLYQESKQLFAQCKMKLRGFTSNDRNFISKLSDEDKGDLTAETKVLGINWKLKTDEMEMKTKRHKEGTNTKREVLKFVASNYDPLGWISPVLLPIKVFIQKLWKKKYTWDQEFDNEELHEYQKLMVDWEEMRFIIPRKITHKKEYAVRQLHVFTDASVNAYAACVYTPEASARGIHTSLLMTKTRLCPVKSLTIPRLELMAAMIGTRLVTYVKKEMQLNDANITL